MTLTIERQNFKFIAKRSYLMYLLAAILLGIMIFRALNIWYQFSQLSLDNFRLEEVSLTAIDGSHELGKPPYGLNAKMSFENTKCPLHFDTMGLNATLCTEEEFLATQGPFSKESKKGTIISVQVDDIKFVKRTNFAFNARMKLKSFVFDRSIQELANSTYFIKISVIVRARFCFFPLQFHKNIHVNRLSLAENNRNGGEGVDRLLEYLAIRTFDKYPVPCLQLGIKKKFLHDFNLNVGCLKVVFDGIAKLTVFITSFSTRSFLSEAEAMKQYDNRNESFAFHNIIPGELTTIKQDPRNGTANESMNKSVFNEDATVFYFITIPLFQDISMAHFMKVLTERLFAGPFIRLLTLKSISVHSGCKVAGIGRILREFMECERSNSDAGQAKESSDMRLTMERDIQSTTLVSNEEAPFGNLSSAFDELVKSKLFSSVFNLSSLLFRRLQEDDGLGESSGSFHIRDTSRIFSSPAVYRKPCVSNDKLNAEPLKRLLNSPKLMDSLKSRGISSETIQKGEVSSIFDFISTAKVQDSENFNFVKIPSFSNIPLLNYVKSEESMDSYTINKLLSKGNEFSFSVSLPSNSKILQLFTKFDKILFFENLMKSLSFSFDISVVREDTSSNENIDDLKGKDDLKGEDDLNEISQRLATCSLSISPFNANQKLCPFLNFGIAGHIPYVFKPNKIEKFNFSFFKILQNGKEFAKLDFFDLTIDYPRAVYMSDKKGNISTLHTFGKSGDSSPPFSIQFTHFLKDSLQKDFFTITSELDLSTIGTELNAPKTENIKLDSPIITLQIPKFNFTVTNSLLKIRSQVDETTIVSGRSSLDGPLLFQGVIRLFSHAMVTQNLSIKTPFTTQILQVPLVFSLNDGFFRIEFTPDELSNKDKSVDNNGNSTRKLASIDVKTSGSEPVNIKTLDGKITINNKVTIDSKMAINGKSILDFKSNAGNNLISDNKPILNDKPAVNAPSFVRLIPCILQFDSKNSLFDSLISPCFKVSHILEENDAFETFSLCHTSEFKTLHEIPVTREKTEKSPIRFHIRNIFNAETVGMPIDVNSRAVAYLVSSPVTFILDVTSNSGCGYFPKPVSLKFFLPMPGETNDSFSLTAHRKCQLDKFLKFILDLVASEFYMEEDQVNQIEGGKQNEEKHLVNSPSVKEHNEKKDIPSDTDISIVDQISMYESENFPEINIKINNETSDSFSGSLSLSIPKHLLNAFPFVRISPFIHFTLSSVDPKSFNFSFNLKNEVKFYFLEIDFSVLKEMPSEIEIAMAVNSRTLGNCIVKDISLENLLLNYSNFFKYALEKDSKTQLATGSSDSVLISAFSPHTEYLPNEFYFFNEKAKLENTVEKLNSEIEKVKNTKINVEEKPSRSTPRILNVGIENIVGSADSIDFELKFGIDALLEDIGCILGKILLNLPLVKPTSHINIALDLNNLMAIEVTNNKLKPVDKKGKSKIDISKVAASLNAKVDEIVNVALQITTKIDGGMISESIKSGSLASTVVESGKGSSINSTIVDGKSGSIKGKEAIENNTENSSFPIKCGFKISSLVSSKKMRIPLIKADRNNSIDLSDLAAASAYKADNFVKLSMEIKGERSFMVLTELHRNISNLKFDYSFPICFFKKMNEKLNTESSQKDTKQPNFRIRSNVGDLPCMYLDVKSPYTINFIDDPLTFLADFGAVTKLVLRFKCCMHDSSIIKDGYLISVPIFLFHLRDPSMLGDGTFLPLNDPNSNSVVRCFWIHKENKFFHDFFCQAALTLRSKRVFPLIDTFTHLRDRSKIINAFIRKAIGIIFASIQKFIGPKKYFTYSSKPASTELNNIFTILTDKERSSLVCCLRFAPNMLV